MSDKMKELEALRTDCLACRNCSIGGIVWETSSGKHLSNVFSTMNPDVKIILVGQNPGWDEVCQGIPFVGSSGKILIKAFETLAGVKREEVYITNVCRCYSLGNRKPTEEEVERCRYFLEREFDIVKPIIAVALGALAFKELTGMSGIMKHSGEVVFSIRYKVPVLVMLHPSPLNTNNPERNLMFEQSVSKLRDLLIKENKAAESV